MGTPVTSPFCSNSSSIFGKLLVDDLVHRHEADTGAVLGNREDRLLRFVEDDVGVVFGFVGPRADLLRRQDQPRSADFSFTMRA